MAAFYARDYRDALARLARFKQLCSPEELQIKMGKDECTIEPVWLHAQEETPPYGTPKCKELCGRHQILLAVINCHRHPGLAQHGGGHEPDLGETNPKGVRGFETVWYVDCHLVSQAAIALKDFSAR